MAATNSVDGSVHAASGEPMDHHPSERSAAALRLVVLSGATIALVLIACYSPSTTTTFLPAVADQAVERSLLTQPQPAPTLAPTRIDAQFFPTLSPAAPRPPTSIARMRLTPDMKGPARR
jgi:hypothetical protein